jgi:hypothetical protein
MCRGPREDAVLRDEEESLGLWEFSPGGQIRLVEASEPAGRASPGAVGVSSQEAVSTGWVQAAVGYGHLHHPGMGGGIQQSLHSQT